MNEHEFDDLLDLGGPSAEEEMKLAGKIRKGIRRQITGRVVAVVMAMILIAGGVIYGLSTAMNLAYYNPTKETGLLTSYDSGNLGDFPVLLNTYIGLIYPGYYALFEFSDDDHVSKGFAGYEINVDLKEYDGHVVINGGKNSRLTVRMGKFSYKVLGEKGLSLTLDTYYNPAVKNWERLSEDSAVLENMQNNKKYLAIDEGILKDISELPDSAVLTIHASFENVKTAEEAAEFMMNYSEASYEWLGVDDPYFTMVGATTGINVKQIQRYGLSDEALEKYPGLMEDFSEYNPNGDDFEIYTGETLTNAYTAALKLLSDNCDFTKGITNCLYLGSCDSFASQYENVSQNGIKVCSMRMRIQKNDLLSMIEEGAIDYLYVYDVALSRLEQ